MSNATIYSNTGFDLRSLWVANTGASTDEHFEGFVSGSGSVLAGHQEITYSTFEFEANGLTYRYTGEFTISADYGLLNATVSTQGSYDQIEVLSGETLVASYDGSSRSVDFGTQQVGVLDLVGGLLTGVLALLFGSNAPSQAYGNLHYDATPGLYGLAFAGNGDIVGGDGNDSIWGGSDDDVLNGGAGADTLVGGFGDDTYVVSDLGDQVQELVNQGNDTVFASISFALGADIENLTLTGEGDHDATGNALDNFLIGNAGANVINGLAGADVMRGLGGNDIYGVDHVGDQVTEAVLGGIDRVAASVSYTLASGQEIEFLGTTNQAGTAAINLTGNVFAQTLYGNAGSNVLNGAGGIDIAYGYGGNDTYVVDNAADLVFEVANAGADRINAAVSYVLASGQEVETLGTTSIAGTAAITLTGNSFAQTLYGNAGANVINGAGGIDVAYGYGGNDTYVVDNAADRVFEGVNAGSDRVNASVSYVLAAAQEVETLGTTSLVGTAAINLTGNALNQTLYGNAGANVLDGVNGLDTLTGYGGADTFAFTTALGSGNIDHIADFSVPADTIQLSRAIFANLNAGTLTDAAFKTINAPGAVIDSDDRILYDSSSGALFYDANGSVSGGRFQFAILDNKPITLASADFVVM